MSDETPQVEDQNAETSVPTPEATPAPEATAAPVQETPETPEPAKDVEMVLCMISKQMVPLDETVELERKKGELLRIHQRYKKFE